jgi:hypothetical protein
MRFNASLARSRRRWLDPVLNSSSSSMTQDATMTSTAIDSRKQVTPRHVLEIADLDESVGVGENRLGRARHRDGRPEK